MPLVWSIFLSKKKPPMTAFTVSLEPTLRLTDEQFFQLCQANPEIKFELTATGELIIMPPTGGETGERNHSLSGQLWQWNQQTKRSRVVSQCFLGKIRALASVNSRTTPKISSLSSRFCGGTPITNG
jgi:Uma2 family endonuclease